MLNKRKSCKRVHNEPNQTFAHFSNNKITFKSQAPKRTIYIHTFIKTNIQIAHKTCPEEWHEHKASYLYLQLSRHIQLLLLLLTHEYQFKWVTLSLFITKNLNVINLLIGTTFLWEVGTKGLGGGTCDDDESFWSECELW